MSVHLPPPPSCAPHAFLGLSAFPSSTSSSLFVMMSHGVLCNACQICQLKRAILEEHSSTGSQRQGPDLGNTIWRVGGGGGLANQAVGGSGTGATAGGAAPGTIVTVPDNSLPPQTCTGRGRDTATGIGSHPDLQHDKLLEQTAWLQFTLDTMVAKEHPPPRCPLHQAPSW